MVIGMLALALSALCLLWAIAGIIKPSVLFCVPAEKRNRKHAFLFPLLVSISSFLFMAAAVADLLVLIPAGIAAFLTWRYLRKLRGYRPQEKEQTEASARQSGGGIPDQQQIADKQTVPAKLGFWARAEASAKKYADEAKVKAEKYADEKKEMELINEEVKLRMTEVWNSDYSKKYTLDLIDCECTCPDWKKHRANAPADNPSRLCKHLVAYFFLKPREEWPEWMQPFYDPIVERACENRGMPIWRNDGTETGEDREEPYSMPNDNNDDMVAGH